MRIDLANICDCIPDNGRILDLGCGDGELLAHLKASKNITGYGIENDPEQIQRCIDRGVNVIEKELVKDLSEFADNSFDVVLMTFTLQVMKYPDVILDDMLRVGQECVVTFPNFGNIRSRLHLLFKGRMPVTERLPHQWYDTPNIHFCTVDDFELLCRDKGYKIIKRSLLRYDGKASIFHRLWPNLFAETAVYHLSK